MTTTTTIAEIAERHGLELAAPGDATHRIGGIVDHSGHIVESFALVLDVLNVGANDVAGIRAWAALLLQDASFREGTDGLYVVIGSAKAIP